MKKGLICSLLVFPILFLNGCNKRGIIDSVKALCYYSFENENATKEEYRIAINTFAENKYLGKELTHKIEGYPTYETKCVVKFQYEISFTYNGTHSAGWTGDEKQKLTIFDGDKVVGTYQYKVNYILNE